MSSADSAECLLCRGAAGDAELDRIEVWQDEHWRLTTSVGPHEVTPGFSFLEPKRHIPHVTDLDGDEAATLGLALGRCANALRQATGAQLVYVYIFGGGVPHLHVHLAPHVEGDALNDKLIEGEFEERKLPSGASELVSKDYPSIDQARLRAVAADARRLLKE